MAIKNYNGVSYDDSVDYSAAIEQAKAAGQDTSQLEAARQAKIDDKYKGVEPVMYGSNQKYSDVKDNTSEEARQTVSNAVKTSSQINGYDYTNPSIVSADKNDYSVLGKHTQPGGILAGIPRDAANANKKVKMGNYTITFNELGMAVSAIADGGASATDYIATGHANDTVYHKLAYDAAARGEWDLASQYMNMMAETYQRTGTNDGYNTGIDYKAARLYEQELQNQFGYDDETYYNKRYDEAYGPNAAAVWDATNGAVRTYAELVNIVGAEKAQQMVESQIATNPSKYQTAGGVPALGAPVTQQFGADAKTLGATLSANFGNGSGLGNGMVGGGGGYDLSDVIRSQKEAELEAKLANLKGAFNKSEASLNDALAKLPQEFDAARNEIAGQSAIAQRAFDERAAASGLSSGASGQAALARSSVLQKGLAEIAQGQANAASEIELQKALLVAELEAAISEALAQGEAELAAMLYNEMIRVQELEREDALIEAQREAEQNELALKYAAELGLDASSMLGMGGAGGAGVTTGGTQAQSSATNPTASKSPSKAPSSQTVDNGGLPSNAIRKMQAYYGASVDGAWGPESRAKAGNKSATEAWNEYIATAMPGIEQAVGMNRTATGRVNAIQRLLENGEITEAVAEALLIKFGDM